MAGGTLESTFGIKTLNKAITTFASEPSQELFQSMFRSGSKLDPDGRTAEWDEITMPRGLAPVVAEDGPFPKAGVVQRIARQVPMIHVKQSVDIPASKLYYDRGLGVGGKAEMKDNAAGVVATEVAALTKRIKNTVEYMCYNVLLGSFDTGNVEGSTVDVTFSQTTGTLSEAAAWSTAATKILSSELPLAVAKYVNVAGRMPSLAIINDVAERSLLKNDEIRSWAQQQYGSSVLYNNTASEAVLEGLRLGGLDWKKSFGGYADSSGTFTRFASDTKVIFLPPAGQLADVLGLAEGYGFIPVSAYGGLGNAESLVVKAPQRGFYGWAEPLKGNAGVTLYVGYVGLAVLIFPTGVLVLTIT